MIPKSGCRFRKRSCSKHNLERQADSKKRHVALAAGRPPSPSHLLSSGVRSAPARQVSRLRTLGEAQRLFQRRGKARLNGLALDPRAQKIRPQKLAEWRAVLGIAARSPQRTGQAAE